MPCPVAFAVHQEDGCNLACLVTSLAGLAFMGQDDPFVVRSLAVLRPVVVVRQFWFRMGRDVALRAKVMPRSAALVCRTKLAMAMGQWTMVTVMKAEARDTGRQRWPRRSRRGTVSRELSHGRQVASTLALRS